MSERLDRANETIDFILGFWEKIGKAELAFSKSLEELCTSRQAKLVKLFGNTSTEPIKEVDALWKVCVEDIKKMADHHREVSDNLHANASAELNVYKTEDLPSQQGQIALAKRLLGDLKKDRTALANVRPLISLA